MYGECWGTLLWVQITLESTFSWVIMKAQDLEGKEGKQQGIFYFYAIIRLIPMYHV